MARSKEGNGVCLLRAKVQTLVPTTPASRRNVKKGTFFNPNFVQLREEGAQELLAEAGSNSASKFEFFSFIDTDKQRGKILSIAFRFGIPANDVSYVSAACVRPGFPLAIACGVGSLNGN